MSHSSYQVMVSSNMIALSMYAAQTYIQACVRTVTSDMLTFSPTAIIVHGRLGCV